MDYSLGNKSGSSAVGPYQIMFSVHKDELKKMFGIDHIGSNKNAWQKWSDPGAIISLDKGRHRISEKHWLIGDSIASDLILL